MGLKNENKGYRCFHCQDNHRLAQCKRFIENPVKQRIELLKSWKVCLNCLHKGHTIGDCRSRFRCKECNGKHHTLIHQESAIDKRENGAKPEGSGQAFTGFGSCPSVPTPSNSTVLLGTVQLLASGDNGVLYPVRAVLDSGNQHSFVTSELTSKLGAKIQPFYGSIRSLAESAVPQSYLKGKISCTLRPYEGDQKYAVNPIVVDRITTALPIQGVPSSVIKRLSHYKLSDHQFGESLPVDLLIGRDLFPYILTGAPFSSGVEDLLMLPTTFGLVVSGSLRNFPSHSIATYFLDSPSSISAELKEFWEIEEPSPVDRSNPDDAFCEDHFMRTHERDHNERYIERLPFNKVFARLLCAEAPDSSTKISLIKAKSKVAPVKFCPIPRLELCGALLLSRLISSISKSLSEKAICFSDSKVVLAWLNTVTNFEEPKVESSKEDWISRFSSYPTLIRTIARILRFLRRKTTSPPSSGPITAEEFFDAEIKCAWYAQRRYFPKAIFEPTSDIPRTLAQLAPFLDERGVLRVGGRMQDAPLNYTGKHPILIPYQSPLSRLIIQDVHERHFHAGPTLTLSLIRSKYWIPRAQKLFRNCLTRCVRCRTLKAKPTTPFMAPLPKERFSQFRAFIEVGVDYAGPFLVNESSRRNAPVSKAYLTLFVCIASKAVHLELVSSLTTTAFLDALERFISRRGVPKCIWSDHGTNFVGASRFVKDVYRFQNDEKASVVKHLSSKGIEWKFIPPRAPHFGGLWEAGVKSVKSLLAASVGRNALTYQELYALLNSRPLCGLTEDVLDYDFLTPGHFLIGAPLYALPEPSEIDYTSCSHHDRWRIIQAQIAHVWDRWRKEYLHTLQQRSKWNRQAPGIKPGDLVILLEKKSLLGQWPVARVVEIYPGRDGITRTVSVRTPPGSLFTRAVTSLVPLFHPEQEHNSGK